MSFSKAVISSVKNRKKNSECKKKKEMVMISYDFEPHEKKKKCTCKLNEKKYPQSIEQKENVQVHRL